MKLKKRLTIKDVNVDCGRFGVVRPANVFPRIGWSGVLDQKRAARFNSLFGDDADSSSIRIIADHLSKKNTENFLHANLGEMQICYKEIFRSNIDITLAINTESVGNSLLDMRLDDDT